MTVELQRAADHASVHRVTRRIRVVDTEWKDGARHVLADRVCTVVIEIDLDAIALNMGAAAVRSKGGKSVDGKVTVRHKR